MKKREFKIILLFTFMTVCVITYNACGLPFDFSNKRYGTATVGNPFSSTQASQEILFAVCSVLDRCQAQVPFNICTSGVQGTGGIGSQLGLPQGNYPYSSIESSEASGSIVANSTATTACTDTINNLSCSDPSVVSAYNPQNQNPFANVANMIPLQACNQVFTPPPTGVNLEVPIEMTGHGLASSTTPTTFSRTRTSLNTADYDGIVTYAFEIVADNNDTVVRNVTLVDSTGITVASIAVTPTTFWNPTRYRSTFSAIPAASDYRIATDATTSGSQMHVWVARLIVQQIGATRTKLFVPLMVGAFELPGDGPSATIEATNSSSYSQPNANWWVLWQKHNSAYIQLAVTNPWTFEAVMSSDAGTTAYASIFDAKTGLQVTPSEVTTTSATPTLVSSTFADSAPNFNDLDNIEVQIKGSTVGGTNFGYIYRAGIWIKLTNLAHAEIYYRDQLYFNFLGTRTQSPSPEYRIFPALSLFSQPYTISSETTSYVTSSDTSCALSLSDFGQGDSGGTGTLVTGSTLNVSSLSLNRLRSAPFTLTPGDRFTNYVTPNGGTGSCQVSGVFLVIGF